MPPASDSVRLMFAPGREYRTRAAARGASWWRTLAWPARIALLLGIVTSVAATGRVGVRLFVSQTICWAFVPALQLLTAALLVGSVRHRPIEFARAVELLFEAHGPWSLWLLWAAIAPAVTTNIDLTVASGLVPSLWTAKLVSVFGREALGLSKSQARWRAALHQAATWLLILTYIELVSQLLVRITGGLES